MSKLIFRDLFGRLVINLFGWHLIFNKPQSNEIAEDQRLDSLRMIDETAMINVHRNISNLDCLVAMKREGQFSLFDLSEILTINGILVFRGDGLIPEQLLNDVVTEFRYQYSLYESFINSGDIFEDKFVEITHGGYSYSDMANKSKSVINCRGKNANWDAGMVDIFNPESGFLPKFNDLKKLIENLQIPDLLNLVNPGKWALKNTNIYFNKAVTKTRRFHVDDYSHSSYKLFIYLSDVIDFEMGPYCYVKKSHLDSDIFKKINQSLCEILKVPLTDTLFLNLLNATPILGKRGSVILSSQSGAHRGYPQGAKAERLVAVFHYLKSDDCGSFE